MNWIIFQKSMCKFKLVCNIRRWICNLNLILLHIKLLQWRRFKRPCYIAKIWCKIFTFYCYHTEKSKMHSMFLTNVGIIKDFDGMPQKLLLVKLFKRISSFFFSRAVLLHLYTLCSSRHETLNASSLWPCCVGFTINLKLLWMLAAIG